MTTLRRLCVIVGLGMLMIGCSSTGKVDVSKLGPPISAIELAERHNERVDRIQSLWARVSVRANGVDRQGKTYEEQGEGHLQIEKPNNVSLSIGKLGETYFVFGANASEYWAFNLADKDRKLGQIGRVDLVTPQKTAQLGLPIHPAELLALSGLMPIELAHASGTRWTDDGKSVGISIPAHWGAITLWFDPRTLLVVRSQAFDQQGQLIADASLSRYKEAIVSDQSTQMVPGKIELTSPADSGWVRIELSEPRSKKINRRVYQPKKLIRAYRIDEVIDLDADDPRAEFDG
ncbi:MAG: hypothetical protein ACWA5W_07755 [Phycisphaerales bacterium]